MGYTLLKFSVFFLILLLVASCAEQEAIDESTSLDQTITFEGQLKLDQQEYEKYVAEHGEVTIEHMTLEELQAFVKEHNLPPVSQETVDAYDKRGIEKTTGSCSSGWINYCGDLNANGTFSSSDLVTFNNLCAGVCNQGCSSFGDCPTWSEPSDIRRFGYLSYYAHIQDELTYFDGDDYIAAYNMILGLESC